MTGDSLPYNISKPVKMKLEGPYDGYDTDVLHHGLAEIYVDFDNEEALQNLMELADSPVMLAELIDLLQYRYDQIDLVDEPMDIGFDCPLDVHCTYTARQILTAFDDEKVMSFREGVKWLPAKNTDVFFITLNKSDKDYSPTTMYNDYSINEILFHWQSQSTTSDNSPTGQRYIHHKEISYLRKTGKLVVYE